MAATLAGVRSDSGWMISQDYLYVCQFNCCPTEMALGVAASGTPLCADFLELLGILNLVKTTQRSRRSHGTLPETGLYSGRGSSGELAICSQ